MSKFINLDEFNARSQKSFQFKGKSYNIQPLGVGAFIDITAKRQALANLKEDVDPTQLYELTAGIIKLCVPDLPDEEIKLMSIPQLMKLAEFVQQEDTETKEVEEEMGK